MEVGVWEPVRQVVLSLLGLLSVSLSLSDPNTSLLYGTVNGNVTFSLTNRVNFTEITWKKEKHKVVDWDADYGVQAYPPFRDRIQVDSKLGSLVIWNLTSSDEGVYEMESPDVTSGLLFNLTVFDPLPSPAVNCTWTGENISVHCQVPESYSRHREQLKYRWDCTSPLCPELPEPGGPLWTFPPTADLSQEVWCFVENLKSNRTSSVLLSSCAPVYNSRHRYTVTGAVLMVVFIAIGIIYTARRKRTNPG